ncbi:interferon regulatory factor 2-like [Paramuricea clavata]|uniref:Interferon regulatory factor 2-like n=1 Tax=Paramuricea clavata TaxID=317549 RepID=A0A7D9JG61_PARCT|nr:interferon regulatory factor 2-like [Paramuricea clavata]
MRRRQQRERCFLEWLLEVLDERRSPKNAYWLDENAKIFAVRWVHAKSPLWTEECAGLFKLWKSEGRRTWRNRSTDSEKQSKTNFRMNLRSTNFVEVTDNYKEKYFEFPVRVFKINNTTNNVGEMVEQREAIFEPVVQNTQILNSDQFSPGKNTPKFYSWSNNPSGITIGMTNDWNSESSNRTCSKWNTSLNYLNSFSPEVFNQFYHQSHHDKRNSPIVELQSVNQFKNERTNELYPVFEPYHVIEDIAGYLSGLDTSGYPGCIPELSPCNLGNITSYNPGQYQPTLLESLLTNENTSGDLSQSTSHPSRESLGTSMATLRHSLVTSPTDSGFMERSSTASFSSSCMSCEETSGNFDDIYSTWSLDNFSDSVFE